MDITNYLCKRVVKGRALPSWQLRVPIPRALHGALNKKEVWKSLGTSDRSIAARKAIPIIAELQRQWDALSRDQQDRPVLSRDLDSLAANRAYHRFIERLDEDRARVVVDDATDVIDRDKRQADLRRMTRLLTVGDLRLWEPVLDRLIVDYSLPIRKGSPEYHIELEKHARLTISGLEVTIRRNAGDLDAKSSNPLVLAVQQKAVVAKPGESLLELFEGYAATKVTAGEKRLSGIAQDRMVVVLFAEFVGRNRAISSITVEDARDFRNTAAKLPPSFSKRKTYRGLNMREAAVKARDENEPQIKPITLARYVSTVSPFFTWLVDERYTAIQPFATLHQKPKKGLNRRPSFSNDQLNAILVSPLFTGFLRDDAEHQPGNNHARDWRFWIPLICLFTGSRVTEVAQLRVNDITEQHGDTFIGIRDEEKLGQHTKSGESRQIPIHRLLREIGFLSFHRDSLQRSDIDGNRQLFPELAGSESELIGAKPARFWRDYLVSIGIKAGNDGIGMHSFRHRMADELRRAGHLDAEIGPLILGHGSQSTTGGYGSIPQGTAKQVRVMMDGVKFEGVSFEHLTARARAPVG